MTQISISDIKPQAHSFKLKFEIIKKLTDDENGLLCQVSDQTGTAKFLFANQIKKFIIEGKVYVANNAKVVLQDGKPILQLQKQTGSITKQPLVLPFKDNTYDLSAQDWNTKILKDKIAISSDPKSKVISKEQKPKSEINDSKQQTSNKKLQTHAFQKSLPSTKTKPKYVQIQGHSSRHNSNNFNNSNNFRNQRYQKNQKQKRQDWDFNKSRKQKSEYRNQGKYNANQSRLSKNNQKQLNKLPFLKTYQIAQCSQREFVNSKLYVSKLKEIQREINKQWKRFTECILSDNNGSVEGSFYGKTHLENGSTYEFKSLKVRFYYNKIVLQQVHETTIKLLQKSEFKPNFSILENPNYYDQGYGYERD